MKWPAYPKYKDSGIEWLGEVPEGWGVVPIKHLLVAILDTEHKTCPFFDDGQFLVVRTPNIRGGKLLLGEAKYTDEDGFREWTQRGVPRPGDILFTREAPAGEACIVPTDPPLCIGQRVVLLRANLKCLDPNFAIHSLYGGAARIFIQMQSLGSTVSHFNMSEIVQIPMLAPPLPEQHTIASFLDRETGRIDLLVSKKRTLIERLKEKRTALISRTVTRGLPPAAARAAGLPENPALKPSGIEWLGEVPEGWEIRKFSREVRIAEGQVDPETEPYLNMLLIGPEHVQSGSGRLLKRESAADQAAESGKYLCRKGDVIYSKIRPALRKLIIAPDDCLCSADMYPLCGAERLENRFIYWLFLSEEFSAWALLESDRVAMPKINRDTLNELRMPVPPLPEQQAIAAYLDAETAKLDALVAKVEAAIERLLEYRTALITAAVTGKIDVRGSGE